MNHSALYSRAPYRVRPGTRATIEDRHGAGAFTVLEPVNFPAERVAFAEALVAQVNEAAAAAELPAFLAAAE